MNNKGSDQTARMGRLICTFVVRIWHKTRFRMTWPRLKQSDQCPMEQIRRVYGNTLVHVNAPEVTYKALVSAFFRTGAGENAIPKLIIMFV